MNRLKSSDIVKTLKNIAPDTFKARKGLGLKTDLNPDFSLNSEGVFVSRPDSNTFLQTPTMTDGLSIYDEEVEFDIVLITTSTNPYFDEARDAIESLSSHEDYKCYYARSYTADEVNNNNNITVEYSFTFNQTIAK